MRNNLKNRITITWDMPVYTDRTITATRPDVIVKDLVNYVWKLIDRTIPSHRNNALKEIQRKEKQAQSP